jgi:hypothetical protein
MRAHAALAPTFDIGRIGSAQQTEPNTLKHDNEVDG